MFGYIVDNAPRIGYNQNVPIAGLAGVTYLWDLFGRFSLPVAAESRASRKPERTERRAQPPPQPKGAART
jgi:hypothetical protein